MNPINIEILQTKLFLDISYCFQSSIVMNTALMLFNNVPRSFISTPENYLPFASLKALEDNSVVKIAETLKEENNFEDLDKIILKKKEIIAHRNFISHPFNIVWGDKTTRELFEKGANIFDIRLALILDLNNSINIELLKRKSNNIREINTQILPGMVFIFESILKLSMKEECQNAIGTFDELKKSLMIFRDRFLNYILEEKT
jgi:hypothetical protein